MYACVIYIYIYIHIYVHNAHNDYAHKHQKKHNRKQNSSGLSALVVQTACFLIGCRLTQSYPAEYTSSIGQVVFSVFALVEYY